MKETYIIISISISNISQKMPLTTMKLVESIIRLSQGDEHSLALMFKVDSGNYFQIKIDKKERFERVMSSISISNIFLSDNGKNKIFRQNFIK